MKSPDKTNAVVHMKLSKNVEEVRRFVGMLTYYFQFNQNFLCMSHPLQRLLQKLQISNGLFH